MGRAGTGEHTQTAVMDANPSVLLGFACQAQANSGRSGPHRTHRPHRAGEHGPRRCQSFSSSRNCQLV